MVTIDKTKPVLVTGATGYVAGWLITELLKNGITVHAAVRNPNDERKLAHLKAASDRMNTPIKFFKSDLLEDGSYAEAMAGCELVFHTASPFTSNYKDAQRELIDPAVKGTENVLKQANQVGSVKRVILTSSCAAIYTDCTDVAAAPGGVLTEKVWNESASLEHQPYSYSKTLAEKKAWEISNGQKQWDLVVINPSLVMGPAINIGTATSESMTLLKQMGDGTMKSGVPNIGIGIVDVRDLAKAHFNAGYMESANGRNIISGHNSSFLEVAHILNDVYGTKYPVPKKALPKWLLMLIGPSVNKSITRKFVRNNVNLPWRADNSKSREELAMNYRPLKETMIDSFEMLISEKIVKLK
ncbi:MAG: NAD-dependent epimerase/dehydratase family protein [Cryomorphaceae bacterium]|nr:NAD-dependent epimerase/dehydratase family protein [Cryomorphaceae bacterium]